MNKIYIINSINNYQQNQEQYQTIKPAIKMSLLILSSIFGNIILWIVLGVISFQFLISLFGSFGLLIIPIFFAITVSFSIFMHKTSLEKTEYKFYNNRLEYYDGFLVKNRKTINYNQISNISQSKGIIEGYFKLGTIYIDTPGSSQKGHELSIINLENSDQIYDWISKITSKKN